MTQKALSPKTYRLAVACFFFIAGICFASWASRIPDVKNSLRLSDAALGGLLFALPVGSMVSLPISGWLVAHWGSKKAMLLGAIAYPFVLFLIGYSATVPQLVALLFCFGLFGNLMNISVNTQAIGVETLYGRSIMASFHGVWSAAGFTGAAVGAFMVSKQIDPFYHFCFISSCMILLGMLMQRFTLTEDARSSDQPLFAKPDAFLLKLGLIAFSCMACEGTMFDWSGVYFQKVVQAPKEMTTLGYAAFMSTMAGGRFIGDRLVIKLGNQKMLEFSGIVICAGLLLAVFFPNIVMATTGFLLVGMGVSSVVPLVYGQAGKQKTMSAGVALAAVSTIGFLGFLLGPPLIGFIAEAFGLQWSFTLIAVLGLGTTLLAGFTRFIE
ncbi:MAG: MFS transporter [Sphingobacteriia bacterium]|nr:MFS transporter [Sphingobacteriia bacterium]